MPMKHYHWILIGLACMLMACSLSPVDRGESCEEKDVIIQALQAEKSRYEKFLRNGNATLQEISLILDSIDQQKNGIDAALLRTEGVSQPELLDRIRDAKDYIEEKEERIAELENELKRSMPDARQAAALTQTIIGLKAQVKEKEKQIDELGVKVTTLTQNNIALQENLQDVAEELDSTKLIAEESQEEIKLLEETRINLEEQLKNQEELAKLAAAEKAQVYFDVGLAYEREGDSYRRRKRKNEKYDKALENFRLAHQSGMAEATRAITRVNSKKN